MPARILFSYARADEYWVQQFKDYFKPYFKPRTVKIIDCPADDFVGSVSENERTEGWSDVIIAFVSKTYTTQPSTVAAAEWENGFEELGRQYVVAIILDVDAIKWWQSVWRTNPLVALSMDLGYVDFTDSSGGGRVLLGPQNPEAIKKIADLASVIEKNIAPEAPPITDNERWTEAQKP